MMNDEYRSQIKKYLTLATEQDQLDHWFAYLSGGSLELGPIETSTLHQCSIHLGAHTFSKLVPQISNIFKDHIYRERYAVWIDIITAAPLSTVDQLAIENKMLKRFKVKKTYTLIRVMESIIGGMIIEIHGYVIDASLQHEIQKALRKAISGIII
jgi:hypothetical protein